MRCVILALLLCYARTALGQSSTDAITQLSVEQAESLVVRDRPLFLNGLKTLRYDAAQVLSEHCGSLHLNGLTEDPDAWALGFGSYNGPNLSLNGLKEITPTTMRNLARCSSVSLGGLRTLNPEVAAALAQGYGNYALDGLATLSPESAKMLEQSKANTLSFDGVTAISPPVARSLAKIKVSLLSLNGLTELPVDSAEAFSEFNGEGGISLNGVTTLPVDVAQAVAKAKAFLFLDGIKTLSEAAAEKLANTAGHINLSGLTTLTHEAAEPLRRNRNILLPDRFR